MVSLEPVFCTQDGEDLGPELEEDMERRASSEPPLLVDDFCNLYNKHVVTVFAMFIMMWDLFHGLFATDG